MFAQQPFIMFIDSGFDPSSIAGLKLWLKADAGTFQTVSGATAAADGDPVGQWLDQSGQGNHVSQGTSGKRPLLKLAVQNGKPVVRFDGVDDYLRATFTQAQPVHVFAVASLRDASVANKRLFDGQTNDVFEFYNGLSTRFDGPVAPSTSVTYAPASMTAFILWGLLFNGTSSAMRHNGAQVGAGNAGTNGFTALTLAARGDLLSGWGAWDLCEFLLYSGSLSSADVRSVEDYLNSRWGIWSVVLYDTFTDANGTALTSHTMNTGGGWTAYAGTWDVQSNQAHLSADGGGGQNVVAADAGTATVTLSVDYAKTNNSSDDGVVGRLSDNNNYWLVRFDAGSNNLIIYEKNAGSFTQRASGSYSWSTSAQTVYVRFSGTTIAAFAGATAISYASATFNQTATRFGLRCNSQANQGTWDNFKVQTP